MRPALTARALPAALAALLLAPPAPPASAAEAKVVGAEARPEGGGTWRFSATVAHPDTGWDHYADAWRVESPEGETLGVRELLHPHVDEQPFTRSLGGVVVPEGTETVRLRARDSLDGWAETAFDLALPAD